MKTCREWPFADVALRYRLCKAEFFERKAQAVRGAVDTKLPRTHSGPDALVRYLKSWASLDLFWLYF